MGFATDARDRSNEKNSAASSDYRQRPGWHELCFYESTNPQREQAGDILAAGEGMGSLRDTFMMDATHALKRMLRRPSFTLVNSVPLGLALGASVLAFAVLCGYVFRPLPYVAPGRLLLPRQRLVKVGLLGPQVSVHFYRRLRRLSEFHGPALVDLSNGGTVTVNSRHEFVHFMEVTPSRFALLGVNPLLARTLSDASGMPDGPHEVVLSYTFWQSAFGGRPRVLRRTAPIGGTPMRVVGVMPPKFVFPIPDTALRAPFVMTPRRARSHNINYLILIRMPRGWNLARVNGLLRGIRDREISAESPAVRTRSRKNGYVIDVVPYRQVLLSYAGGSAPPWGLYAFT